MLAAILGCPSVFGDKSTTETGSVDTEVPACSGSLEPHDPAAVSVLVFSIEGVGRVVTPLSLCIHPDGTRVEIVVDDDGSEVRVQMEAVSEGVFNLPSESATVVVEAGVIWSGEDIYAGTLSLGAVSGSLVADATASDGESLSLQLSWESGGGAF